jgi:hypothetical protein
MICSESKVTNRERANISPRAILLKTKCQDRGGPKVKRLIVRYKVKADKADENNALRCEVMSP